MQHLFSAPDYAGGRKAARLYNDGPMTADDRSGFTPEDSLTLLVAETNREEFESYLRRCQQEGYRLSFRSHSSAVEAAQLIREDLFLFASFNPITREVRITQDFNTSDLSHFSYRIPSEEAAVVVQYGLFYDPDNTCTDHTMNCGMFYVVRLCDNSLFVIDGGHEYQFSRDALQGLHRFLHELTGTREGEPIELAGWYFSHAHNDHMAAFPRLLRQYPGQYHVRRLLFNFPSLQTGPQGSDPEIAILLECIRQQCPGVPCLKLHGGQKFQLADASFEVLYTHEDAITMDSPDRCPVRDFNSTSSILKMTSGGTSFLWLGDSTRENETLFQRTTRPEIWKADVVQVAHHCINNLPLLYSWIDADWAMLPNNTKNVHTPGNLPNLQPILEHLPAPEHLVYGEETCVFRFRQGKLCCLERRPLIGWEYDGTDLFGTQRP